MMLLKSLIACWIFCAFFLHAEEYRFGEGLPIADSPLTIGGYFSTVYGAEPDTRYLDVDDIAIMAYGEFDRFAFMAELEASDVYIKETGSRSDERSNGKFHIERLYGDYFFGENERIRVGKFNSDIGFWNQMPINVLRDTTSSPTLVKDFFPKLTTGIHYESRLTNNTSERLSMTVQHNGDLDSDYNNLNVDRHYGVAYDIGANAVLWRFAGGYFRYDHVKEALYTLGSAKIEKDSWNVLAEGVLRHDVSDDKTAYDVYAQGVWHVHPQHDLILRSEIEKSPLTRMRDSSVLFGYTYRPLSNVALKGEYQVHQENGLNLWLFSISALF